MKSQTARSASRPDSHSTDTDPQRVCSHLLDAHADAASNGAPLLTEAGIAYVRQQLHTSPATQQATAPAPANSDPLEEIKVYPSWHARRLWLGERLLKEFGQPAPYQTAILDAFQRQGWANDHIHNPLPREEWESEADAKQRLHDAIKNLDRTMPPGTIRFRGDGTGKGVYWEYES